MDRYVWCLAGLLLGGSLTPVYCGAAGMPLTFRAEEINRRQTQDLRREQRLYRERTPATSPAREAQILDRQQRQLEHQRQLQQQGRARVKQVEQAERSGGAPRIGERRELQRLKTEQEIQRLNFRMRRSSPAVR